jgi:hypothetical protein
MEGLISSFQVNSSVKEHPWTLGQYLSAKSMHQKPQIDTWSSAKSFCLIPPESAGTEVQTNTYSMNAEPPRDLRAHSKHSTNFIRLPNPQNRVQGGI